MEQFYSGKIFYRGITVPDAVGTVLYIHGLGESGLCFENLMLSLSDSSLGLRLNQLAPDLPGYGKSLPPVEPITLIDLADSIPEWCDRFIQGPVILTGHSMGGVIGQLIAERNKWKPAGFINIEGNLTLGDCVFSGQAAACSLSEFEIAGFNRLKETVYQNGIQWAAQRGYYASMRFAWPPQFHTNSRNLIEFSSSGDAAARFAGLGIPRLYIAGRPRGICEDSLTCLKNSRSFFVSIEDSGHWPFLDQPEIFLNTLMPFLRSCL